MIEEISSGADGRIGRLADGARLEGPGPERPVPAKDESSVSVSSSLRELIERVKSAETFRKERVQQVLEKLQRGELVTSHTIREAAEKMLRGGV